MFQLVKYISKASYTCLKTLIVEPVTFEPFMSHIFDKLSLVFSLWFKIVTDIPSKNIVTSITQALMSIVIFYQFLQ